MTRPEEEALLEIYAHSQNRLRGKLATLVESWGLDPGRTEAMIQTMKGISYDNDREFKRTIYDFQLEH